MRVTFQESLDIIHHDISAKEWLTLKRKGGKEYGCPFCGSSDAVAEVPDSNGKWKCFSCEKSFDVLDVIQQEEGVDWKEAFKMCCERLELEVIRDNDPRNDFSELKDEYLSGPFSTGTTAAPPAEQRGRQNADTLPPLKDKWTVDEWHDRHAAALSCEYLTKTRGIPAEVIARHRGIGYGEHETPWDRKPATWKGDNWKPRTFHAVIFRPSRYTFMMRFTDAAEIERAKGVKKAVNYGTDEQGNRRAELSPRLWNPAALDGGRPVFIVEGIIDALSLEAVGAEAVALQGTSGIDRLMHELDARRAAGKTVPVLVDALDADAPGRKAAKKLKEGAGARGVSVYDGAKIVGSCKDANEALTSDRAAFAAAVKQAEEEAAINAEFFEPSADRKEDAVEEVPAAEQKPADLPTRGGIINPDTLDDIKAGSVLFVGENQAAVKALWDAGAGCVVGITGQAGAQELFRLLEERKAEGKDIPAAVVDCLDRESYERVIVNRVFLPGCEELGITYKLGVPVMVGANAVDPDISFIFDTVGELEAEVDAERKAYAAETAAARAVSFFADTESVRPFSSTGFSDLDAILDGGFYSGLYIVGAISSLGKTTFILQIADYVAAHGQDVLYFSLEMSAYEIMSKSFSRLTHEEAERKKKPELARPVRDILTGSRRQKLTVEQNNVILDAAAEYGKGAEHLHILESVGTKTAEDIRHDVERHHRLTGNWPLVIVDYLQILKAADPHMTDKQATDAAVLTLKQISRDYDIPVFCISSFNRDNYFSPVTMGAFKESGAVEYSADVLIGLQYFGMDIKKEEGEKSEKRRRRLDALREARKADSKEGRPVYIQARVLKNRNGTKDDCVFRYFNRYNHYEPSDKDIAEIWERDAIQRFGEEPKDPEKEREDADFAWLNGSNPDSTGKKRGGKKNARRL